MERIDFHGSFFSVPAKPAEKKTASKTKTKPSFSEFLEARAEEEEEVRSLRLSGPVHADEAEIGKALDAVHISGDKLKKKPTLEAIGEYKEAVAHFLRLVVEASYEARESVYTRSRDKAQQRDVQIHIINEKVEKLAVQIMRSQKDELEILRRVDEIYGLLVDLRQ